MTRILLLGITSLLLGTVPAIAGLQFTDVTETAGLAHPHAGPDFLLGGARTVVIGGAVSADFNGDGWPDLFIATAALPDRMYLNRGDGTFEDVSASAGFTEVTTSVAAVAGDIDNDGDQDLYVSRAFQSNVLFVNNGDGTFVEVAEERGVPVRFGQLASDRVGLGVTMGDYDRDGWLDIVATEAEFFSQGTLFLYRNRGLAGPGFFESKTRAARLDRAAPTTPYTPIFSDLDNDGWPDLPLVADWGQSRLYWNNADGTFLEDSRSAGTGLETEGMGSAIGDFNQDGHLDWFATSVYYGPLDLTGDINGNRLYQNNGDRSFTDVTEAKGVADGAWGWGTAMADFDNDGDLDIVMTNGADIDVDGGFLEDQTVFWENRNGEFVEVADEIGLTDRKQGRALLTFDYDRDGDLDIFILAHADTPILYRNDSDNPNRWLRLKLTGTQSNADAIGARIALEDGQVKELRTAGHYMAQSEKRVHFGLGESAKSELIVTVDWPSGFVSEHTVQVSEEEVQVVEPLHFEGLFGRLLFIDGWISGNPPGWIYAERFPWLYHLDLGWMYCHPGNGEQERWFYSFQEQCWIWFSSQTYPFYYHTDNKEWVHFKDVRGELLARHSVARLWNEQILEAIRLTIPHPPVHARNLFHLSACMWDIWSAATGSGNGYFHEETLPDVADEDFLVEAISYGAYRVLEFRYRYSTGWPTILANIKDLMHDLGYDPKVRVTTGNHAAALGNRVAQSVIEASLGDGSLESLRYEDTDYSAVNEPLSVHEPGASMIDPNRWQPLSLQQSVTQNDIPLPDFIQTYLGPHWGSVQSFALPPGPMPLDPGTPPLLGTATGEAYKNGAVEVIRYSSLLDPDSAGMIDISPQSIGNSSLGRNDGSGHERNPVTGQPYAPHIVPLGDYGRVLAEFWADGPDSETPPGHWNSLANEVSDSPGFEHRFAGTGPVLGRLEWDLKLYFILNAAAHDAAVAAWGSKAFYDYVRPISAIRYLGQKGQSTDPGQPAYHPEGLPLVDGLVEVVTEESTQPGQRHEHLKGHENKVAVVSWRGEPEDPETEYSGSDWILAERWIPYQKSTFVTPAFAGYVSGHSTFSRAAAEVLTRVTGSPFFPGGLATYTIPQGRLAFEAGPTTDIILQWATYRDASDQSGLSRLYGGIHFSWDDGPGRIMGAECGQRAFERALLYITDN